MSEERAVPPGERAASEDRSVSPAGSETSSLLLPPLDVHPERTAPDYGPRPWLEYILDLVGPEPCPRSPLLSLLSDDLLTGLGNPELYGRPVGEESWTFVRAPGVPDQFEALALGWNLAPREGQPPDGRMLRRCRDELTRLIRPLSRKPQPREPVEAAVQRGADLVRLRDDWDVGVALVLRAPWLRRFDAQVIWDTACALGMQWGHLGIFHWHNRPGLPGDEYLFSLWSLEDPGTFAPEWVAAGMTVPAVALGFSVPRSPDPVGVFDHMVQAGRTLQSRLGGKLLVGEVAIASERTIRLWRSRIRTAAAELTGAGFPPGSARALQLF